MKRRNAMNFGHGSREEPEINLIPFIDVLLVVLIFLMLSTTYSKFTEMQLRLPVADTDAQREYPKQLTVSISADGRYMVDRNGVDEPSIEALAAVLASASGGKKDTVVIINGDATAPYQTIINAMAAARRAGLTQITFAAQSSGQAKVRR